MTVNTPVKISGAPRHALQVRTYVEQLALRIRCEFLSQGFWFNFPRTAEMNHRDLLIDDWLTALYGPSRLFAETETEPLRAF